MASIIPLSATQSLQTCSCTPSTYHMKLDFSKTGCPIEVSDNRGLEGSTCFYVEIDPDHDNDFKPVAITDLSFVELDQTLSGIKVLNKFDTRLEDGDIVKYTSVASSNTTVITGGLSGTFRAINQANHSFTLEFILKFSNKCEILPFNISDRLGYFVFTKIDQPRTETCNFASESPTAVPSTYPSVYSGVSPSGWKKAKKGGKGKNKRKKNKKGKTKTKDNNKQKGKTKTKGKDKNKRRG